MAKKVAIVGCDESIGLLGALVRGVSITHKEIKQVAKSMGMPTKSKHYHTTVSVRTEPKIGRNEICPSCNSGKKYKKCCLNK